MMKIKWALWVIVLFSSASVFAQTPTKEERELYELIMEYRKSKGLATIPLSSNLTKVAQTHARDLADNRPYGGRCNLHSWSSAGSWSSCCYTPDHEESSCMWSKPRELTSYKGNGYEIAFRSTLDATPSKALMGWKISAGHHAVMMNMGEWGQKWNAIGIGMYKGIAVAWFGREADL